MSHGQRTRRTWGSVRYPLWRMTSSAAGRHRVPDRRRSSSLWAGEQDLGVPSLCRSAKRSMSSSSLLKRNGCVVGDRDVPEAFSPHRAGTRLRPSRRQADMNTVWEGADVVRWNNVGRCVGAQTSFCSPDRPRTHGGRPPCPPGIGRAVTRLEPARSTTRSGAGALPGCWISRPLERCLLTTLLATGRPGHRGAARNGQGRACGT